jgi:hypothetical protein
MNEPKAEDIDKQGGWLVRVKTPPARSLYISALLLAGAGGLCLCVRPCRSRNFHTAVLTTVTPRSSRNRSAISSSVVSGAFASARRMKSACPSSTDPFGLPCLAGQTSPVARFSRARVAETTPSRKSMLYGLPVPSSRLSREDGISIRISRRIPSDSLFGECAGLHRLPHGHCAPSARHAWRSRLAVNGTIRLL